MARDYFHRVAAETKTRVWVNNPSLTDLRNAMDAGAINCTTNPAYGAKLLKSDHDYMVGAIQSVVSDFRTTMRPPIESTKSSVAVSCKNFCRSTSRAAVGRDSSRCRTIRGMMRLPNRSLSQRSVTLRLAPITWRKFPSSSPEWRPWSIWWS